MDHLRPGPGETVVMGGHELDPSEGTDMRLPSTGVRKNELAVSASSESRPTVVAMWEMADGLDWAQRLAGERVCPQLGL